MLPALNSHADTIYLKNKQAIKGIIKNETEEAVILDVGCGTSKFSRASIESIEKGTEEENNNIIKTWKIQYFDTGKWIPRGAKELFDSFKSVKRERGNVIKIKNERDRLQRIFTEKEKEFSVRLDKYDELNSQLKTINPKTDILNYNNVIAEINTTGVKLKRLQEESSQTMQLIENKNVELSNYIKGFSSFVNKFNDMYTQLKNTEVKEEDEYFFVKMEKEITALNKDFEHDEIKFSKDSKGITVNALLNGNVSATLIVDTGASLVVISNKLAKQLGIEKKSISNKMKLVLANGSTVEATPVILRSVRVGNSEVKNVYAAIIDQSPVPTVDGLLGMTFLSNFLIKIDANENNLVLDKFKP